MPPSRRDLLLAAALASIVQIDLWLTAPSLASAVAALLVLVLAFYRSHALAVVVVVAGMVALDALAGGVLSSDVYSTLAVVVVACFAVGRHSESWWQAAGGTGFAIAALTAANQLDPSLDYPVLDDAVFFTLLLGTPAIVGWLLRNRAELIAELARQAEALRAAQAQQAEAAVTEERAALSIAVHDALAQRIGEMSLQAAGAARVADRKPDRALQALASIEDAGRGALGDIRETIGVLRCEEGGLESTVASPVAPVPAPWHAAEAPPAPAGAAEERDLRADALIAIAVFAAIAIDTLTSSRMEGPAAANLAGVAAIAAPLVFRRRVPLLSAIAVFAAAAVQGLLLTPVSLLVTPLVLLLLPSYSVAAHLPRRPAIAGLGVCLVGTVVLEPSVPTAALALLAWSAGRVVRDRGVRADELRLVNEELERTADANAARARSEERLRIARELHDAVAHSMTVIVLQAGAAQRVWVDDPKAARGALAALTRVARGTLTELRAGLAAQTPDRMAALDDLLARVRPLGVEIEVTRDEVLLTPKQDHVAFSIVQEALTNAVRHAAPTSVRIHVAHDAGALRVEVVDTGRSQGPPARGNGLVIGTGTGLRGLAERVASCGGTLSYGRAGRGFRVEGCLPLEEVAGR